MSSFKPFAHAVYQQLLKLSSFELFTTANGDALWDAYLAAFPEGTNPTYKTRTEHDCSCCKQFIRNFGGVVAIIDGKRHSIWDVTANAPYDSVTAAMQSFVASHPITGLFRSSEASYGAESTKQLLENGTVKTWNHFYGAVAKRHYNQSVDQSVDQVRGFYATSITVFMRGLIELDAFALQTVLELIDNKTLYRGEEHRAALVAFQKAQDTYCQLTTDEARNTFLWSQVMAPCARFRNTVIGTLIQDLSAGMELDAAVRSFEAKVAPANYKRPTALVTPRMVQEAMKTIQAMDLEPALDRRFARLSDVSVNNVLWVDGSVQGQMKGGIEGLLMSSVTKPVKEAKAEAISIDDFMANVLPKATAMSVLVKNAHQNNFMSLTAPAQAGIRQLFKWGNDFAWSYHGNIADSDIRKAVQGRGGRVDGVFRFSHSWNYSKRNASLMDLHVFMPGSTIPEGNPINDIYGNAQRVGWNHRKEFSSGGVQDVDYTDAAPVGYVPVENITFPDLARMPEGEYLCKIHNWSNRAPTEGGFKAEIEFAGQVFEYEYLPPMKHKEWVSVATVTLKKGVFTIKHHLPCSASSQPVWGVNTETFVKVQTLLNSPNYWDSNAVGNKHWFFILEGCKNPEATRGIYNEFLHSNLEPHRKVFELLGDKTKCPPADEQLSGLGFSSTRGDTVTVQVKGAKLQKTYNITF